MDDTIGIDVSKDSLDAYRLSDGARVRVPNTPAGLRRLGRWIGAERPGRVVYEATGRYHRPLEAAFSGHLPLLRVNPYQARRFADAEGVRAKSDRIDAAMLARFGAATARRPDLPVDPDTHALKELQTARTALVRDRTRLLNRLEALTHALLRRQLRARLAQADRQLARLALEIDRLLAARADRARARDILVSIPGIGAIAARAILVNCPEIGSLGAKQAAALAGLAPMTRQSGRWQGRARIEGGRKPLRDALYMPALVAMRHNPDMVRTYARLRDAGKPHRLALTAIMRKLLQLANALVAQDRAWSPTRP